MTTIIIKREKLATTQLRDKVHCLTIQIFYGGLLFDLPIFFKKDIETDSFKHNSFVAIKGDFKEEVRPLRVSMYDSDIVELSGNDDWETFFINYFLSNQIDVVSLGEYPNGVTISTHLESHYVWCDLSKNKLTINKFEFGRYLPLEKPENRRKSTSWTKAVFANNQKDNIKFLQTSWDGEDGDLYQVDFNCNNKARIEIFLSVSFNIGWTELDYRLDKNKYYKAAGQVLLSGQEHTDTFTLLDMGEQDMPFFFVDRANQFIRTYWADSFLNNFRRHIDISKVDQIKNNR